MKKYFSIALVLCIISGFCALLIASVNELTKSIIIENKINAENKACRDIYNDLEFNVINQNNDNIDKLWEAKDGNTTIGYIYKVSGKNAYGMIEVLVGINIDGSIKKIVLVTNTQSFAKNVNEHVDQNYNSNEGLTSLDNIDVKCGATYGAKLVKTLVQLALDDFNGGSSHGE